MTILFIAHIFERNRSILPGDVPAALWIRALAQPLAQPLKKRKRMRPFTNRV
jgi:hypothetical protein